MYWFNFDLNHVSFKRTFYHKAIFLLCLATFWNKFVQNCTLCIISDRTQYMNGHVVDLLLISDVIMAIDVLFMVLNAFNNY